MFTLRYGTAYFKVRAFSFEVRNFFLRCTAWGISRVD